MISKKIPRGTSISAETISLFFFLFFPPQNKSAGRITFSFKRTNLRSGPVCVVCLTSGCVSDFKATRPPAPAHFCSEIKTILFGGEIPKKNVVDFPFRDKIDGPNEEERKRKRKEENNEIIASAPGPTLRVSEKEKKKKLYYKYLKRI